MSITNAYVLNKLDKIKRFEKCSIQNLLTNCLIKCSIITHNTILLYKDVKNFVYHFIGIN